MARVFPVLCAVSVAFTAFNSLTLSTARAQDASPSPTSAAADTPANGSDDIRVLRQLIEQQSRQIETLTQQVTALKQMLEANHGAGGATGAATPAVTQNMPPVQESNAPTPAATGSSSGVEPPKATAVTTTPLPDGGGMTHVVAKGETLISIAKHYKVSVADLLKMNKITDERKLQIGQTLTIPPNAKPSDTSHP